MLQRKYNPVIFDIVPSAVCVIIGIYIGVTMIGRCLLKMMANPLPTIIVSSFFCCALGLIFYEDTLVGEDPQDLATTPPEQVLAYLLPVYVISLIYQMDVFLSTKSLTSYIVIVYIVLTVCGVVIFFIVHALIHPNYEYLELLMSTFVLLPIQPCSINFMFREFAKHKHIATILEVESVVTFVTIYFLFQYSMKMIQGIFDGWTDHALYLCLHSIGALIIGGLLGKGITIIMSAFYNETNTALPVLIGLITFSYFLFEFIIRVSGNIIMISLAYILVNNRHKFSTKIDEGILRVLKFLQLTAEIGALCIYISASIPFAIIYRSITEFYAAFFMYFLITYLRIGVILLVAYIIKRKKFEVDCNVRTAFVLGYSGLKGSFNFIMAFALLCEPVTFNVGRDILSEILLIYFFTLLANAAPMKLVLKLLGFTNLPIIRRANMNTCMKFIVQSRTTIIKNLKEFKYLTNTNWNVVRNITCLSHPYKRQIILDETIDEDEDIQEENEEIYFANTAYCPDCFREIPYDLTENEIDELCLLARSKVIKAKKVSVIRQFERGAINKNCVQVLIHHIDLLLDGKVSHTQLRVDKLIAPKRLLMFIRRFLMQQIEYKNLHPPASLFGKFCFYLTNHVAYEYVLLFYICCHCVFIMCFPFLEPFSDLFILIHAVIGLVFIFDIVFKLIGLQDFFLYLEMACSCVDLICTTIGTIILFAILLSWGNMKTYMCIAFRVVSCLRLLELLSLARRVCPYIINLVDRKLDLKITFGFDIASALEFCCNEIIETLNQIIEIKIIRDIYDKDLRSEKLLLVNELRHVQQERPYIGITKKTKQIIRTTLKAMNAELVELRNSGKVDTIEYEDISQEIVAKIKYLRSLKILKPLPPRPLFREIPWILKNKDMFDVLYSKTAIVTFSQGDVVMSTDVHSSGIYLVLTGVIKLIYNSKNAKLKLLQKQGAVPIIDYISTLDFNNNFQDDITSGSTFGERSFLTQRKYDCKLVADSGVQTIFLSRDAILEAFQVCNNPVIGLEAQMWKWASINLAVAILTEVPLYQSFTQQDIKCKLDRAFVPNIQCYRTFAITEDMDDVLLIDGAAKDYGTSAFFKAPMMVPKNVQRLCLPISSYAELDKTTKTKLMIIPVPGVSDIDVMMREELVGDILPYTASHCILHTMDELLLIEPVNKRRFAEGTVMSTSSPHGSVESIRIVKLDTGEDTTLAADDSHSQTEEDTEDDKQHFYLHRKDYKVLLDSNNDDSQDSSNMF